MSYQSERAQYSKEHIYIVEMELDFCSLTHGVLPCSANPLDDACYNTFDNCQAQDDYDKTTKVYRFCESRSPHPIGIDAIPSLKSVDISPAKIDLKGGLGVRASVSLSFVDHPSSDIDVDPYVNDRPYIASERGSYWAKLRARNPNYQFRKLRVLSGYLVNGEYIAENFTTRHYIIESLNVTGGVANVVGKDPLKLATQNKAQAPKPSTGKLNSDITSTMTQIQLTPVGVGDEYPGSGKVLIGSEVIQYVRSGDLLSAIRAQNNTVAVAHSADDSVQVCLEYVSEQVDEITKDLLVNYANIDPAYIPDGAWASEVNDFLSGLLNGIIVKPSDVFKLLQELALAMPNYLWWDERTQQINLTALKPPESGSATINMNDNIVGGSFKTKDRADLRVNTVFVNFGQFDPTKSLDDESNYQQSYVRADSDSINTYGSDEVQTINTRWLSTGNEAAARQLAALIGRRFADVPREASFSLEAKDGALWVGQTQNINHRDIVDASGAPVDTVFQIMSAKESNNFNYTALEFKYGDALPEDEGGGEPGVDLVFIPADAVNTNLRSLYELQYPTPTAATQAKFILDNGRVCGASSVTNYGIDTGSWPSGAVIELELKPNSLALGKGGDGGSTEYIFGGDPSIVFTPAEDGGPSLLLNYDLTLINSGVIGGGGGGGAYAGGGGAGFNAGGNGIITTWVTQTVIVNSTDGGSLSGGSGYYGEGVDGNGEPWFIYNGGAGGNLGVAGNTGSLENIKTSEVFIYTNQGAPGVAINKNGYTLTTPSGLGTIAGDVIN